MSDINITVNDEIVNIDVIDTPVLVEVTNSPGPAGAGVAVGGTTGQVLAKASNTNYDTVWVNPSTGGVPYNGATGNVNLGEYELKAGQLTLDTSPTGTAAVGTIRWNDTTGTSETTLKGGNVIIKNGVDLVARVVNKVTPNTTLTKAAYQAVRVSGAQGQRLAIELAQANNDAGSADTIGLVTETIATNQEGFIMTVGQLEGINTTGSLQGETWVDGDVLYLSPTTAGALTNIKPTAVTGHIVVIGYVEYAHANNGKIYVKVMNGWELDELHNVSIVTPANNQGLFYNSSNSLWENKTISTALGYTPVPTTRNITINGVTYDLSADRTWTIAAGISGSGASGQVTYWTGASAVSGSNNLFWDNTNGRLGIGTNAPATKLQVRAEGSEEGVYIDRHVSISQASAPVILVRRARGSIASPTALLSGDTIGVFGFRGYGATGFSGGSRAGIAALAGENWTDTAQGALFGMFTTANGTDVATYKMQLFGNGNLVLQNGGTFTDNGQRLQVIGDTLLRGSGNTSATTALTVQNSDSTNLLRVRNDGALLFSNGSDLQIYSQQNSARSSGIGSGFAFQSSLGSGFAGPDFRFFNGFASSAITSGARAGVLVNSIGFQPTSGTATYTILQLESLINQTGGANGITRGLYVNPTLTAAADFRAIETSAGNVLFGSNFFWDNANSRLGIGTNTFYTPALGWWGGTDQEQKLFLKSTASTKFTSLVISGGSTGSGGGAIQFLNFAGTPVADFGTADGGEIGFAARQNTANINFYTTPSGTTPTRRLSIFASGNVGIGGTLTSDPGTKFFVSGDTLLRGSGATSATAALLVQNSSSTNLLEVYNDGQLYILGGNVSGFGTNIKIGGRANTANINFFGNNNIYVGQAGAVENLPSALIAMGSTTKGFLPPRMTTTQKNAIASPAAGLVVYDTTLNKLCVYTTAWETITSI